MVDVPAHLVGMVRARQRSHELLGYFFMNVSTLENVLNLAVTLRFVAWHDRPFFVATVLSHIPLGNKVDAFEDIMRDAGDPDAKRLSKRIMETVERRNKLAHQPIDVDHDVTGDGDTPLRLHGRRRKVTHLTLDELEDWGREAGTCMTEALKALAVLLPEDVEAADFLRPMTDSAEPPQ